MVVHVRTFTDPACVESWGYEPQLRRLAYEFGAEVQFAYVMGGLARGFGVADQPARILAMQEAWMRHGERSGQPIDPRLWSESPIHSSYPACMAVIAAGEQGSAAKARMLRGLREGLICRRRKLDTSEALVELARELGLDARRFRVDLASNATVERLGDELEHTAAVPEHARAEHPERLPLPSVQCTAADGGDSRWVLGGLGDYEQLRAAVTELGAQPDVVEPPQPLAVVKHFGGATLREVGEVCGLAEPPAAAALWRLAADWRLRPLRVLTGHLWQPVD